MFYIGKYLFSKVRKLNIIIIAGNISLLLYVVSTNCFISYTQRKSVTVLFSITYNNYL